MQPDGTVGRCFEAESARASHVVAMDAASSSGTAAGLWVGRCRRSCRTDLEECTAGLPPAAADVVQLQVEFFSVRSLAAYRS